MLQESLELTAQQRRQILEHHKRWQQQVQAAQLAASSFMHQSQVFGQLDAVQSLWLCMLTWCCRHELKHVRSMQAR